MFFVIFLVKNIIKIYIFLILQHFFLHIYVDLIFQKKINFKNVQFYKNYLLFNFKYYVFKSINLNYIIY